jgi:uncharacterized membrane-anchored protein YhcB (DUF1043 family)
MTDPQLFSIIGCVIGVGITLAALIVGLIARVRSDVRRLETYLRDGQTRIETRLLAVEKEQARTSGLLKGLGLTGRTTPHSQPQPAAGG